ncbi:hypothetical protein [Leptolyngbya sp. FACHB-321]|nr:hypothetical protein [Leptolyngbya sp. FACHB-321]
MRQQPASAAVGEPAYRQVPQLGPFLIHMQLAHFWHCKINLRL